MTHMTTAAICSCYQLRNQSDSCIYLQGAAGLSINDIMITQPDQPKLEHHAGCLSLANIQVNCNKTEGVRKLTLSKRCEWGLLQPAYLDSKSGEGQKGNHCMHKQTVHSLLHLHASLLEQTQTYVPPLPTHLVVTGMHMYTKNR